MDKNYMEEMNWEEDRYDGILPGDLPTEIEEAYYESLGHGEGDLWEETV